MFLSLFSLIVVFQQKTAYDMRISDWSSDVCSSDLLARNLRFTETLEGLRIDIVDDADVSMFVIGTSKLTPSGAKLFAEVAALIAEVPNREIGRASCRERVCQYV